jgi:glucose-1-phosphate adenylyltransferase
MLINLNNDSFPLDLRTKSPTDSYSLDQVATIVLAGGQGVRLMPLTETRCKPVISFGGRYNLIDVPISHSMNSGIRQIFIIGQYLANTLQKHLLHSYANYGISPGQLQLLIPEERESGKIWYQGTADAIRQNLNYLSEIPVEYFLILSGDQLYNIHFQKMVDFARQTDAEMVIATLPINQKDARRMGILKIDAEGCLKDFYEKPQEKEILEKFYTDDLTLQNMGFEAEEGRNYLGSMGIYLFKRQTLIDLLNEDLREDFGKHLILSQMKKNDVRAFLYDGYWEDIGTIDAYYHANLLLTRHSDDKKRGLQCYDEKNTIYTRSYQLPGAKIVGTYIDNSILCEGTLCEAEEISHSIIGVRSVLGRGVVIRDSILVGNEFYEGLSTCPKIGENSHIVKAIVDENVTIGHNVQLINRKNLQEYDSPPGAPPLHVRDGIIVVPRGATIPDHFIF